MMPATPGAVVVYRFEDGAVIERLLTVEAMAAVLPPETDKDDIVRTKNNGEDGVSANYALRMSGNSKAQSMAFLLTGDPKRNPGEYSFAFMDLYKLNRERGPITKLHLPITKLHRAYWMPFIEDTIWETDQFDVHWNGFYQPNFVDDRLYAQLAEAPDQVDDLLSELIASYREVKKTNPEGRDGQVWDQTSSALHHAQLRELETDLNKKTESLALRWLIHGFRGEALEGVVSIDPREDGLLLKPPRHPPTTMTMMVFELEGWRKFRHRPRPLVFFLGLDYADEKTLTGVWQISTNSGTVIARGATPLQTLQSARKGYPYKSDQASHTILPISEQGAWFAANYKVGAPTFDMEPYRLLDAPGPVRHNDAWFITWAAQEFGP